MRPATATDGGARRLRRRRPVIVLALALGVSVGCAPAGTSLDGADPSRSVPAPDAASALPIPFASLVELADDQRRVLHDAEERSLAACMQAQGFRYTPRPYQPAPVPRSRLGDVAFARAHGYDVVDRAAKGEEPVPENDPAASADTKDLSPGELEAWMRAFVGQAPAPEQVPEPDPARSVSLPGGPTVGFDPESCTSKARSAVYGDDRVWQRLQLQLSELQHQVTDAALGDGATNDPAYADALERWRACLRDRGHDHARPLAAAQAIAAEAAAGPPDLGELRAKEVAVATADAECVQSSGLLTAARTSVAAVERRIGEANQGLLLELEERQQQSIDRARALADGTVR